jgi:hypothetical protein
MLVNRRSEEIQKHGVTHCQQESQSTKVYQNTTKNPNDISEPFYRRIPEVESEPDGKRNPNSVSEPSNRRNPSAASEPKAFKKTIYP